MPYFTQWNEDLPKNYVKSCEKFLKWVKQKQKEFNVSKRS